MELSFGFLPRAVSLDVGSISVETLPCLENKTDEVLQCEFVHSDWFFAPPALVHDIMTDRVRELPRPSRVFGMPKTHLVRHSASEVPNHLRFLVWVFSFIYGIRLTETDAGFLDATPIKIGMLTDMVWYGKSEGKALQIAEAFWQRHSSDPTIAKRVLGILHAHYISHTPTLLEFESFIYAYIALDGCYSVWTAVNGEPRRRPFHRERVEYLCNQVGCVVPSWASAPDTSGNIADVRNPVFHEGLFFGEPLGFQAYAPHDPNNADLLQMQALVCRILCAILGLNDRSYITSPIDTRQSHGIRL